MTHLASSAALQAGVEDESPRPSSRLFRPDDGRLVPVDSSVVWVDYRVDELHRQLRDTVLQPGYPCIAALRSISHDDFRVGIYGALGDGTDWRALRQDLLHFLSDLKRAPSPYRTMFAVFPDSPPATEDAFENAMWHELSCLTSLETRDADWGDSSGSRDPSDENFVFSLGGEPLFVVGVHPQSVRRSRRFPFTALVFNAFSQFEHFEKRGTYDRMVAINRQHAATFDGSVNPMVEQHSNKWEAIQFSGRQNPPEWKCPFRFLRDTEKK